MSSILPYKVFGKRLAKNRRIFQYMKARLQSRHPLNWLEKSWFDKYQRGYFNSYSNTFEYFELEQRNHQPFAKIEIYNELVCFFMKVLYYLFVLNFIILTLTTFIYKCHMSFMIIISRKSSGYSSDITMGLFGQKHVQHNIGSRLMTLDRALGWVAK